jgi:zinc protease
VRTKLKRSLAQPAAARKAGARITEHKLENGLTVLLAERHHDPVVTVMLWYRVGSRDEEEREAGVSHFLEHMMFKGSRKFAKGEIDRVTTELGGSNNAFTTADHTAYWFEFASDRWEKALDIEADRMRQLLLEPTEFESEKKVVLEELSMGDDDPWRALSREVQMSLFPRHPYRRPVIGFADSLKALGPEDMRDYHARHYRPSNAVLVVCGDIDPSRALASVRGRFGAIPDDPRPERARRFLPAIDEPAGERRLEIRWDDEGRRLCIAWPTTKVGTEDDWALDLASTILAGGKLSRLYRRLVLEKRLATSVSSHNDTRVDSGAFWLFLESGSKVSAEELERAVDLEIAELCTRDVGASELARAKRMIAAGDAHESETVSDIAEDLGEFAVDATWRLALEVQARLASVSARAIRECAAKLLRKERRVVGWCLPKDGRPATGDRGARARGKKR